MITNPTAHPVSTRRDDLTPSTEANLLNDGIGAVCDTTVYYRIPRGD
jgi:hypothetical protein